MLYRDICKIIAFFLFGLAGSLLVPLGIAIYYQFFAPPEAHFQPHTTDAFVKSFIICSLLALGLYAIGRKSSGNIFRREGLAAVVGIWLITPGIAALPFWFSGTLENPYQAYFEAASGLTTTGATVMSPKKYDPVTEKELPHRKEFCNVITTEYVFYGNIKPVVNEYTGEVLYEGIEAVGKAVLFWRSFLQWLGGMGIILLFAAILPALGVGGKVLFQAELTGPMKSAMTPRIKETAMHLWKIYFSLTALEILILLITNREMGFFDAITISFSTLSTGGFSVKNASIGAYQDIATEWVVIIFMIVGSINFTLYFYMLKGKLFRIYEPEFILYLMMIAVASCIGVWLLVGTPEELLAGGGDIFSWGESFRIGAFQVIAAMSSTGFAVANYDVWPFAAQALLLIASYLGGMSGSTAGGMKTVRHFMLFRIAQYKVESLFRPETVRQFRIGDKEVDNSASILVLCFFLVVIAASVLGTFIYIVDGIDPQTSLGLVACMINNTGVAFRMAGPENSLAFLSNFDLVFSSLLMILGRLEFFAVLAILVPAFWREHS